MIKLSHKTIQLIKILYSSENDQQRVTTVLENECAEKMPFCEKATSESLERVRFAVLKLTQEKGKFEEWVKLSNQDWRDVLVSSGLWRADNSHQIWAEYVLNKKQGFHMFCRCPNCKELFEAQFNDFGHRYNCGKCNAKEILEVEHLANFS